LRASNTSQSPAASGPAAALFDAVRRRAREVPGFGAGVFQGHAGENQMNRDHIAVDLSQLARDRGLDARLGFVRRGEVHTRQGGFVVRVDVGL
jgi:hypothetical protein